MQKTGYHCGRGLCFAIKGRTNVGEKEEAVEKLKVSVLELSLKKEGCIRWSIKGQKV